MTRRILVSLLLLSGFACIGVAAFGVATPQLFGLTPDGAEQLQQYLASSADISIVGADSDEENQRKRVVFDPLLLEANGGTWPFHGPQETGDCSGFTFAGMVENDQAVQIKAGVPIEFQPVSRQWMYSIGRWQNGRQVVSGEGSMPSLQAEGVQSIGVLFQNVEGVPKYSGRSSNEWGNRPPPIDKFPMAAEHKVRSVVRLKSAQDVCNAINAGYPVGFGSMRWGTSNSAIRLISGLNVARDTANWPHAQMVTGYDGATVPGQRFFRITNSWGPNAHLPLSQMPGDRPGGYYITWETMDGICREGMTFALSGTEGFRKREFVPDWSVIGAAGPTTESTEETEMSGLAWFNGIDPGLQLPLFAVGVVMVLAATFLLLTKRGNWRGKVALGATMLMLAGGQIANAQETVALDWSSLGKAAGMPVSSVLTLADSAPTVTAEPVNWSLLTASAREGETAATGPVDVLDWSLMASVAAGKTPVLERRQLGAVDQLKAATVLLDDRLPVSPTRQMRTEILRPDYGIEQVAAMNDDQLRKLIKVRGLDQCLCENCRCADCRVATPAVAPGETAPQVAIAENGRMSIATHTGSWTAERRFWWLSKRHLDTFPEPGTSYPDVGVMSVANMQSAAVRPNVPAMWQCTPQGCVRVQ